MNLDDRLITEPNSAITGATPIAVNELDLSQPYNQSSQGCESPGLSRGLVEYLSLGGKVSAKVTILIYVLSFLHSYVS